MTYICSRCNSFIPSEDDWYEEKGTEDRICVKCFKGLPDTEEHIDSPKHYVEGGIETIDYMKAKLTAERFIGYLQANVVKYISRCQYKKNELEDLKKARWYLDRMIKELE